MLELSRILSSQLTLLPFILSAIIFFKYREKRNSILFFVYLTSLLVDYYGQINRYLIKEEFIIETRIFYDLVEHIVFFWYCASLIAFKNWKKITGVACAIIFAAWFYMGVFMTEAEIMDNLGTYEMIEMITFVPLAGFAMMKQVELNYKEDNYAEQVILFAIFFYAFSTIVILGIFNTAIGKEHYYIHNISAIIKDLLFAYGFWLIIKRERKKKKLTEFSMKPTEF